MEPSAAPTHSPFTCDTFSPHVNETFTIHFDDGVSFSLELVSAEPVALKPHDGRTLGKSGFVRRDPFILLFRGPSDAMLRQGLYNFRHEALGEFAMSVVPVGPGETGWLYESVFN